MSELRDYQLENNAASRDRWSSFRAHRDKITELLRNASLLPSKRLCVLGAGNCNDIDLVALLATYGEVHLVDLDAEALAQGVARQGLAGHPALFLHGGLDLTGMLDELAEWDPDAAISEAVLTACAEAPLQQVRPALPGPFDVVASTCLLSQLVSCVVQTAGEQHPQFLAALQAVRAGHLRLLADLAV